MLAETKALLIRLRGQWVALDPDQLRRGLEFLSVSQPAARPRPISSRWPPATQTTSTPRSKSTAVRADGWLGDLLGGAAAQSLRPLEPPDGFTATLRPYRSAACRGWRSCPRSAWVAAWVTTWAWVRPFSCWPETLQRHQDPDAGPTLLLCPMSLVGNWQREAAKFAPRPAGVRTTKVARLHGDALRELLEQTDLIVSTYTTATRDIDEAAATSGTGWCWTRRRR